jgi:hypothetical protein
MKDILFSIAQAATQAWHPMQRSWFITMPHLEGVFLVFAPEIINS